MTKPYYFWRKKHCTHVETQRRCFVVMHLDRDQRLARRRRQLDAFRYGMIAVLFVLVATCYLVGSIVEVSTFTKISQTLAISPFNVTHIPWAVTDVLRGSPYIHVLVLCIVVMGFLMLILIGYLGLCCVTASQRTQPKCAAWLAVQMVSQFAVSIMLLFALVMYSATHDNIDHTFSSLIATTTVLTNTLAVMMAVVMNTFAQCYVCTANC